MPVGAYASSGVPVPDLDGPTPQPSPVALEMPEHLDDLFQGWLFTGSKPVLEAAAAAGATDAPAVGMETMRR